jgi:hypothetical protein
MKFFKSILNKRKASKLSVSTAASLETCEPKLPVMTVPQIIVTPPTPTDEVRLEDLLQEQYGSVTILRAPRPTLERRDSFTRLCKLGQTGYMTVPSAKALDRDIDSFTQEELEQIGVAK